MHVYAAHSKMINCNFQSSRVYKGTNSARNIKQTNKIISLSKVGLFPGLDYFLTPLSPNY